MKPLRVIVTACGAPGAPGIIKLLRQVTERNIHIIGVDARETASGLLLSDEGYMVPHGQNNRYVPRMLEIAEKTCADVVLPLSSMELLALAENVDKFGETKVVVNKPQILKIALNKRKAYDYLQDKVPVPTWFRVNDFETLKESAYHLGYPNKPVCFKPSMSKGSRGFAILQENSTSDWLQLKLSERTRTTSLTEASQFLGEKFNELLVMEYLSGPEYSVDCLVNNGETLVAIPRLRQETKLGISSLGVVEQSKGLQEIAYKINEAFQFRYNINIQFKYDSEGTPRLLEVNPRVSGTICLSCAAGPNLPYLAIKMALGEDFTLPPIKWGLRMVRHWNELYY